MELKLTSVDNQDIFYVDDFLSTSETRHLIQRTEQSGFKKSTPSGGGSGRTGREEPRSNEYTVITDQKLADQLFIRIQPFISPNLEWMQSKYFPKEGGIEWTAVGLVDRFRFYRYNRNDSYPRHMDGSYRRTVRRFQEGKEVEFKQQSFLTLLIYLNEDFEGGSTNFFPDSQHCRFLSDMENKEPLYRIQPKTGRALVNIHTVFHEGSAVERGTKYVVRTDILFEKKMESHPKLEKFSVASNAPKKIHNSNLKESFTDDWEKLFEPSCKAYHD